jgi:hypothetical protein
MSTLVPNYFYVTEICNSLPKLLSNGAIVSQWHISRPYIRSRAPLKIPIVDHGKRRAPTIACHHARSSRTTAKMTAAPRLIAPMSFDGAIEAGGDAARSMKRRRCAQRACAAFRADFDRYESLRDSHRA